MLLRIKAVALDEHRSAFFHCAFNHSTNGGIENSFTNSLITRKLTQISGDRMPRVKWQLAFELCAINDPLAKGFNRDFQCVVVRCSAWRHDTVYRGIDKADVFFYPSMKLGGHRL